MRMEVGIVHRREDPTADGRRCHRLVGEVARRGGWSAVTEIERGDIETVIARTGSTGERPREVAVVRVWDEVTRVERATEILLDSAARERERSVEPTIVSALVVVTANGSNSTTDLGVP